MKVKELIQELSVLYPEREVIIYDDGHLVPLGRVSPSYSFDGLEWTLLD